MTDTVSKARSLLPSLTDEYITGKGSELISLRRGLITKEKFLDDAGEFIREKYSESGDVSGELLKEFEEYIFGYSRLTPLLDDPDISDIRVMSHRNVRVKKNGKRMDSGVFFSSEKEYRQFIDYIAAKNRVSVSNLSAIQRFTDSESHPGFILRFTVSMPIVNTYDEPYLCIRKVPKTFPLLKDLVGKGMLDEKCARILALRFRMGSTLICGGNSSGKTSLLNALKETIPDDSAVMVVQQADELTTMFHPDMMFLHSVPPSAESKASYDLEHISIAGLTMDVDFFLVGEIKGAEALYILNAACTGQICAGTIHSTSAMRAPDKLVDYAMYESRYSRNELMRMMDCFKTLIFMKDFKVANVYACKGWNEERRELDYERLL
ncbi:MAG: CpaF family protein [Lachnospiraceae bacterium]|nr:CpaF family protein [Lachnospiraceae bacterium]MBO7531087.1 CpaF family protein [Lachnospiraceae bacterium]